MRAKIGSIMLGMLVFSMPLSFLLVHFPSMTVQKDAEQYNKLAINIIAGRGYSIDGVAFSNVREPVYPIFVSVIYRIFGINNFFALEVAQLLILGILGYVVYMIFAAAGRRYTGYLAGLAVDFIPSYSYYANQISTELLFASLLAGILWSSVRIAQKKDEASWREYALLGILCGVGTLIRAQILLLLPFMATVYLVTTKTISINIIKKIAAACAALAIVVGPWILYVHINNGSFAVTSGRPERALYIRGIRAGLSYSQLTQYGIAWMHRSLSGGYSTPILDNYEYHKLDDTDYTRLATSPKAVSDLKQQSIRAILANPGQYLYGNAIEVVKLAWVEHDYLNYQSKYLRAGMYFVIYAMFIFGIIQLFYSDNERRLKIIAVVSVVIVLYNVLVLTLFDTIPRYNTPLLFLYAIVGFVGATLFIRRRQGDRSQTS